MGNVDIHSLKFPAGLLIARIVTGSQEKGNNKYFFHGLHFSFNILDDFPELLFFSDFRIPG